jgi:hypothetical protein
VANLTEICAPNANGELVIHRAGAKNAKKIYKKLREPWRPWYLRGESQPLKMRGGRVLPGVVDLIKDDLVFDQATILVNELAREETRLVKPGNEDAVPFPQLQF